MSAFYMEVKPVDPIIMNSPTMVNSLQNSLNQEGHYDY